MKIFRRQLSVVEPPSPPGKEQNFLINTNSLIMVTVRPCYKY